MREVVVLVCALVLGAEVGDAQDGQAQQRVVTIRQGQLRGYRAPNHDVFQFFGVPYALAPTGRNRFKAPLPAPMWFGVFDAVNQEVVCPNVANPSNSTEQENCLIANVHVPITNQTNLPVLVIVHGGAFFNGRGVRYIPNSLVGSKNIIAVTFNYRLGPHGFLCLGTEDAPGNAGLKDQVVLLQWVRDNIASFGGNPNDVTISGCSAGGVSVDLLMLSSMSNGLFNKVIAESGCSSNTFAVKMNPLQNARSHAENLGFTNVGNFSALTEFYLTTPVQDLFDGLSTNSATGEMLFQPCVENNIGQQRFLEDAPINILKSGNFRKVPVLYGYAKMEGLFNIHNFDKWSVVMNENFSAVLPADLRFENNAEKVVVAERIKYFYFGNNTVGESTILEYVDYRTDAVFLGGILRNVALLVRAGHNETYLYEYSFTHNGSIIIPHTGGLRGATHCDQFRVVMDHTGTEILSDDRLEISEIMRDVTYNFMTTGNPTPPGYKFSLPVWPPAGANRSPHLSVGNTIQIAGIPAEERVLLWDDIYELYGAVPQPPTEIEEIESTTPLEIPTEETIETTLPPTETDPDEEDDDDVTTTPLPDSASVKDMFSYQFWIMYTVIVLAVYN